MKAGLSTACFAGLYETEEAFGALCDLRADCCEANLRTFYEYRPEFAKKYGERLDGVSVNGVCADNLDFGELFSPSRRVRGDGFYWLDQILRSAQLFKAENFVLRGVAQTLDLDALSQYINGAIGFCARYGKGLCLQNFHGGLYDGPWLFSRLKEYCAGLSGVFDLRSARASGYPYTMYLKDMSGSIAYAKLCGFDGAGNVCMPERGNFDYEELLKRLKGEGFDGDVIIDAPAKSVEDAERSLGFIKELIYKI